MLDRRDGRYANTAATDFYLDRNKPSYIGGILEMANARLFGFWNGLPEALRTVEPQNEPKGKDADGDGDLFDTIYEDPAKLEMFLTGITWLSLPVAYAIVAKFHWRSEAHKYTLPHAPGTYF